LTADDDASGNGNSYFRNIKIYEDTDNNLQCDNTASCAGVDLDINFDNAPTQTSWEITDTSGTVVASSGGNVYGTSLSNSSLSLPNITCLPDGCYDLKFYDSVNNGMCPFRATASSSGTFITQGTLITPGSVVASLSSVVTPGLCGNYSLKDANGTVLASGGGSFGASDSNNFCVSGGVANLAAPEVDGLFADGSTNMGIVSRMSVLPNLVKDELLVSYRLDTPANAQLLIMNINGQILQQHSQGMNDLQEVQFNVSDLPSGFYFVQLVAGDSAVTRKFVKQ